MPDIKKQQHVVPVTKKNPPGKSIINPSAGAFPLNRDAGETKGHGQRTRPGSKKWN